AAKLNHPNIVYIHEIGEHDGDTYIAMEYVDGKSLRDKIVGAPPRGRPEEKESGQAQGPAPTEKLLSIDEITDIATQICEGLQEAHKADITHRDIKPENILIDNSGRVKLLDFGLAQMKGVTRLTMETSTVGTAKYMSPEQYKAADIDHRTDIWSFGVVLFEMLTGQIPFEGEYDASVMYSVVNTEPERATAYRNDIPGYLDTIINKCLEKDPASRFQSMNDLIKELKAPSPVTVIEPEPETERSIVVLPFENMSSDPEQEYFSDGLTEEIITDLSHIHGLKVISRTSAMMLKDTKKDMLTIGRELNVQYVLEGSVRKAGNNLRITAQLIDATTDAHLWAEKYNGTLEDVFNIQEQVSRSIVEALKVKLTHKESKHLAERPIDNVQAYEYYLFAKQDIWRTTAESNDRAMQYIEQGYEIIGPNELLLAAQGTIYWGYVNFGLKSPDTFEMYLKKAKDCADKVFELNSESSSGHVLMGQVYQQSGEPKKSIFHFQQAVEKDPNNPDASSWLGYMYASSDRIIDAEPLLNIAAEIDPLNILFKVMKSFYGFYSGDYVSGSECFKEWYMADKSSTHGRFFYAYILGLAGKTEKACSLIDWDRPESYINSFGLFYKYALQGNASKALESLTEEAEIAAKWDDLWSLILTEGYSLINEKKKALYWLENTIKYGISNYNFLNEYDPFLENIRSEPRFKQLLECVKYGLGIPTDKATTELENDIDRSIVVLPFENMSSDPEQEYFSDGLTEEIITDLSHIHDLRVISRNSAMMLKGSRKETKTIANELNVQYVLEGSVRKAGNNLRITAQLINAPVDAHLWAEKYNGTLDDVFDIQEKVSRSIVDALKVKLSPEENVQIAEHS
ncbi:MAG: protein kinase, partial [Planctomycetes bacterium]|nr:protein kinase [Planctomycetota bacterium]